MKRNKEGYSLLKSTKGKCEKVKKCVKNQRN